MDHLVVDNRLNVPYVVQSPYDAKGFHSFPERSGWKLADDGSWRKLGDFQPESHTKSDLEAFLQSWLFFGVLTEVLSLSSSSDINDFICENSYGTWHVTTKKLSTYLESWASRVQERPKQSMGSMLRASIVLTEAHSLVTRFCGVAKSGGTQSWDIDPAISLSFMILGETLSHALSKIAKSVNFMVKGWFEPVILRWGYSEELLRLMKRDGWCPYELRILLGSLQRSACGQLFAMHLSYPKIPGMHHRECSENDCKGRKTGEHRRRHWDADKVCACRDVRVDMKKLTDIIPSS